MRRRVTQPFDARHVGRVVQQLGEVRVIAVDFTTVGVDVLAEERDLSNALARQLHHFAHYVRNRPAHFGTAGVRHDAERTVLAATFHDRQQRGRAIDLRCRQCVELLDRRKGDVDHLHDAGRDSPRARGVEQRRQPVQRLRTEHDVNVRRAALNRLAFLARDATADADQQRRGSRVFNGFQRPSCENTFSCAFSRTEQVFNSSTSASSADCTSSRPWLSRSRSSIRDESYSFI